MLYDLFLSRLERVKHWYSGHNAHDELTCNLFEMRPQSIR